MVGQVGASPGPGAGGRCGRNTVVSSPSEPRTGAARFQESLMVNVSETIVAGTVRLERTPGALCWGHETHLRAGVCCGLLGARRMWGGRGALSPLGNSGAHPRAGAPRGRKDRARGRHALRRRGVQGLGSPPSSTPSPPRSPGRICCPCPVRPRSAARASPPRWTSPPCSPALTTSSWRSTTWAECTSAICSPPWTSLPAWCRSPWRSRASRWSAPRKAPGFVIRRRSATGWWRSSSPPPRWRSPGMSSGWRTGWAPSATSTRAKS